MDKQAMSALFADTFSFWDHLDQGDRDILLGSSQEVTFRGGSTIHDGNQCTGVILVRTGSLRMYMLSEEGKEVTLYRLFPGDMCMMSASCVLHTLTFDVFVDAEEASECVIVGGCAYAEVAERVPEVKIFALEAALSSFSDVMWVMEQILFMSLDKRLAIFLMDEIVKSGSDTVSLSHEQIARYIGSAREVVSRMLKYFAGEGIIEGSRRGIRVIDKQRLRAMTV